jgi:hypothetical protein
MIVSPFLMTQVFAAFTHARRAGAICPVRRS